MLTLSDFHDYQLRAVNHQITNPRSFLWIGMGLGKTIITLTTIAHLQRHGAIRAALVVAPLRVVQSVWEREARKWEHTRQLRFSLIHGSPQERLRAVTRPADVYLINYEGLVWLSAQLQHYYIQRGTLLPFDMLILDESSKMKQHATKRMEAIVPLLPYFSYRTGLTGTPASNGLVDLFGQFLVIDNGERLGSSYSSFLSNWFDSDGYGGYRYQVTADGERAIHRRVVDIVLEMSQQEYLQLPDFIVNDLYVDLEPRHRAQYDRLERELFTELDSGVELEVLNEAAKTNKCLAAGTEILSQQGWIPIEKWTKNIKVWDGIEWVLPDGLVNQGIQETLELDGVRLTPDHLVLTTVGWVESQEILNGKPGDRYDWPDVRIPDCVGESRFTESERFKYGASNLAGALPMRKRVRDYRHQPQKQHRPCEILRLPAWGGDCKGEGWPRYDGDATLDKLVKHAISLQQGIRQRLSELWGTWDQGMSALGHILSFVLGGYRSDIQRQRHYRATGQQRGLHSGELPLAFAHSPRQQQENQCIYQDSHRENKCGASCEAVWPESGNHIPTHQVWMEGKRSVIATKPQPTYDLTNCGPRHRFVVRSPFGKIILVHNCLQYSNGAAYVNTETREWEPVHDAKLDALEDIVEEAAGEPVLVAYTYRPDAYRIMKRFPYARNITGMSASEFNQALEDWQAGRLRMLIAHPASAGHGIDGLQARGRILVWFGLNWSLELYLQFNARLHRQGQSAPVVCHRILTRDTLDDAVRLSLEYKTQTQEDLRRAVSEYRRRKERTTPVVDFMGVAA